MDEIDRQRVYYSRKSFPRNPNADFADFEVVANASGEVTMSPFREVTVKDPLSGPLAPGPIYTRLELIDKAD